MNISQWRQLDIGIKLEASFPEDILLKVDPLELIGNDYKVIISEAKKCLSEKNIIKTDEEIEDEIIRRISPSLDEYIKAAKCVKRHKSTIQKFKYIAINYIKELPPECKIIHPYLYLPDDYPQLKAIKEVALKEIEFLLYNSEPTIESYKEFIIKFRPFLAILFFGKKKINIPRNKLTSHMYITGATGSGKTHLLKFLLYELNDTFDDANFFVLDPHGDMAQEIARWGAWHTRFTLREVVYIDPYLDNLRFKKPIINPFWGEGLNEHEIDILSQELTISLSSLINEQLSLQMTTILQPCIATILRLGNRSIIDIQKFMLNDPSLIEAGKRSPNPAHREFFKNAFMSNLYNTTKTSIYTKIQNLINNRAFYEMMVGKPSVNIRELMNGKKNVVLFNLAKGRLGTDASKASGKLITALITSFALARASLPEHARPTTYLMIDEMHNYISSSIDTLLTESRKYRLYLVLAHQLISQISDTKIRNSILANTAIKFIGKNSLDTLRIFASEIGVSVDELQKLQTGEFWLNVAGMGSVKVKIPKSFMIFSDEEKMTDAGWKMTKEKMIEAYYSFPLREEEGGGKIRPKFKI